MDRKVFMRTSEKEWYYGNLSDNEKRQNGIGLKRERDGSLYYGFWEDGLRTGFGVLCEPDGSLAAGTWEKDKARNIMCKVYSSENGLALFCGKSERGKPADGTLLCSDGKLYHGIFTEWRKEEFDGEGALWWPDKRIYAGRWKNGGTDIGGVIRRPDGRMTGTLSNVRNGYVAKSWQEKAEKQFFYGITEDEEARNSNGVLFYMEGEFFAGGMRGGQRSGFGIYRSQNEDIYIGEWDNGDLQGRGMRIRWTVDSVEFYAGMFKNSLYDGEGCRLSRMQDKWDFIYSGVWKEGKKSGTGLLNLNDGEVYAGEFAEDQRDGAGESVGPDGTRNAMNWKKGVPNVLLEQINGPGPLRKRYDKSDIIPRATLNSMKDDEEFGEEQCFVGIRADADAPYQRTMRIAPGCDYEIRIFYHNNADAKKVGGEGTASETRLRAFFTKRVRPGENGIVSATISFEDNHIPVIWDGITIQASEELSVTYKIASARIYNKWKKDGRILPQTLFTENGVYLGTDELNGILPPGSRGYVTFLLHISGKRSGESESFSPKAIPAAGYIAQEQNRIQDKGGLRGTEIKKRRSRISIGITAAARKGEFEKRVSVDIGEELLVKVAFTNGASNRDISISVTLPPALELIGGSSVLELSDGSRRRQPDSWIREGLTLSNFFAEGEGEILFRLRYLPDGSSFGDMRMKAMIETDDITMQGELQITGG